MCCLLIWRTSKITILICHSFTEIINLNRFKLKPVYAGEKLLMTWGKQSSHTQIYPFNLLVLHLLFAFI